MKSLEERKKERAGRAAALAAERALSDEASSFLQEDAEADVKRKDAEAGVESAQLATQAGGGAKANTKESKAAKAAAKTPAKADPFKKK